MHEELQKRIKGYLAADLKRFEKNRKTMTQSELQYLVQAISTRKAILYALKHNRIAKNDADIERLDKE